MYKHSDRTLIEAHAGILGLKADRLKMHFGRDTHSIVDTNNKVLGYVVVFGNKASHCNNNDEPLGKSEVNLEDGTLSYSK